MIDFKECFNLLAGNQPFDWQKKLFLCFTKGEFPNACDIPTGLGKTNVMVIWLIALGRWLRQKDRKIPLRLVYVVDRRVIIDQATEEAKKLLDKLAEAMQNESSPLHSLAQTFSDVSMKSNKSILALST